MTPALLHLAGGLGLFLFGMLVLTDALRHLASRNVRAVIRRFTTSPLSGAFAGAATTALTQSSSATLVTVIGFVGAGIMTFPQAIGVIYGANIGSTMTGWIVAMVGLKFKLGAIAMPLLLVAILMHMAAKGRAAQIGLMLAGFSIVFIGLDLMQDAASGAEAWLSADLLPQDTFLGRLMLVGIGMVLTVVIQSSGAGMAAVLVLLSVGSVTLAQAVAMVIGMNVGTTFTGVLAAIGGSRDMKRTAAAHTAFNLIIGTVAFATMGLAVAALMAAVPGDGTAALVVFHTGLNVLGMLVMLPLTTPFAHLIQRLLPTDEPSLTDALQDSLLATPDSAMDAALTGSGAIAASLFGVLGRALHPGATRAQTRETAERAQRALEDLREYLARINLHGGQPVALDRYAALLHLADHLVRLARRLTQEERIDPLLRDPLMHRPARALGAAARRMAVTGARVDAAQLARLTALIDGRADALRRSALLREHVGMISVTDVFTLTDAMRWLHRTAHNSARALYYMELAAAHPEAAQEKTP